MPAPYYDDQRYVSEDSDGPRSHGSRQYPANPTSYARYERYEIDPPSLQARQDDMKGRKVTFCMSGDRDCKGVDLCINHKIRTFGSLLAELDKHPKIKPKGGVRFVFRKDDNRFRKIEELSEIQAGDLLVVSDRPTIDKSINYGETTGPSPTKLQRSPLPRRSQKVTAPIRRSVSRKNDTIIVMNKERMTTYKLNPQTSQLFEQVLDDIGDMLKLGAYKPLQMHCVNPGVYTTIDSFTKLNSHLHATELRSNGKETPKFLICKNGEHPEDALPEKTRKAFEKKGLIKTPDSGHQETGRYDDEEEPSYDQVEDGAPEPEKNTRRNQMNREDRSPTPPARQTDGHITTRKGVQRDNSRDVSPKQNDEPQTSRRPTQRQNLSKSQSKENVASKQNPNRTPRQNGKLTQRRQPTKKPTGDDSETQNQDESDSDSDYPEPRVVETKNPRARLDTPEC